jgi:hypothetical protein
MRSSNLFLRKALIICCALFLICSWGCARLGGVKTLMSLGASDKLKEKASAQETKNFQRLKAGIENQTIAKDITEKQALKMFGKPVIVISQDAGAKWAYKPAQSDWFEGEKIYLFFNSQGRLTSWQYNEKK